MEETEMVYKHYLKDNVAVFELEGSLLNEQDRLNLKNEFTNYLDQDVRNFLIDLSNLKHINSTGLGVFITLYTKVRGKGGEMIVCNPSDNIINLLTITKLTSVFTIVNSVEEGFTKIPK
jgi:anti-sigma B factor antagonist